MAGLIAALSTVANIATAVNETDKSKARALLSTIGSKEFRPLQTDGSITKLLSNFIVEPIAIVSNDLKHEEVIENVLDVTVDVFASFYLQAFEVLRTIYRIDNALVIDILGTDNGSLSRVVMSGLDSVVSKEEIRDYLSEILTTEDISLSLESNRNSKVNKKELKEVETSAIIMKELEISIGVRNITGGKKSEKKIRGLDGSVSHDKDENLVENIYNTEYVVIPITIKTNVVFTDFDNILNMLKPNANDKLFGYRLDEYRAGAISLMDLIFASDLIKEYKKNKLKDKDDLISMMNKRTLSANSKIVTSNIIGYEKYYNMIFITAEEKILLNKHLTGDVIKPKYKEKFMEEAKALLLTIIDLDYERMIMLTKDIKGKSDTTLKAISKRKDNSADYGEIIKSVMANKPVVF